MSEKGPYVKCTSMKLIFTVSTSTRKAFISKNMWKEKLLSVSFDIILIIIWIPPKTNKYISIFKLRQGNVNVPFVTFLLSLCMVTVYSDVSSGINEKSKGVICFVNELVNLDPGNIQKHLILKCYLGLMV